MTPTNEEKIEAGEILSNILFNGFDDVGTADWLHKYLDDRSFGVEKILASDLDEGSSELQDKHLPQIVVDMFGTELFEGKYGNILRDKILEKLLENEKFEEIFQIYQSKFGSNRKEFEENKQLFVKKCISELQDHQKVPWRPGRYHARRFVEVLGINARFAGIQSDPKAERVDVAVAKTPIGLMKNFQKNMSNQTLEILRGNSAQKRAIVTLPTGAGKTRIVVEALVQLLKENGTGRNILWIAQSQEVCEQAIVCFKQIWEDKGSGAVRMFRAWGDNDLPTYDEQGIIVGSVSKLSKSGDQLEAILETLSAVIIDEAHHSVAPSYIDILERLHMSPFADGDAENDQKIPLIGLTATPERHDYEETKDLLDMYGKNRIYPNKKFKPMDESGEQFDASWTNLTEMREKLTKLKYLAKAEFLTIDGAEIQLTEEDSKYFERDDDRWMNAVAIEKNRNKNIKKIILENAKIGKKILYFGPNVSQSNAMARILEKEGIRSVCITSDTRYSVRKLFVDKFNKKGSTEIQVMCNYNVLSTGFDSPDIDVVVIARPTKSRVAYQQMVGRGLRGEEFGGKAGNRCTIITVKDNIKQFNNKPVHLAHEDPFC
ncbi:MAG: DEAD/DEAH box helicase [Gammaproteobacteria bacterium]|nr:DEAD/DEAH box helicase [Gammaproteobacteria bacterium]